MQPSNLRAYAESDERVEKLRKANRLRAVQAELQTQEAEEAYEFQRERKIRAAQRESALADHLVATKRAEVKDEKMLQLVRENDPELRNLAGRIQAAQMTKTRHVQMAETQRAKEFRALEEKEYMSRVVAQAKQQEEEDRERAIAKLGTVKNVRDVQREQMLARQEQRRILEEQSRFEREQVDAIVAKVQEQDYLLALERLNKQQQEKKMHEDFISKRDEVKREEHTQRVAEDLAIRQYLDEQNKRKESDAKLKQEREALKTRILAEQSRKIAEERAKKEELEALINEYYEEKRAQKQRDEERAEMEKKAVAREQMIAANAEQMRMKQVKKDQEIAEEHRFRQEMMERLAKEERMDQMGREKQARMKADHMRRVQELIDAKQRQKEEDAERERMLLVQQKAREDEWARYVAIEKKRMLDELMEILHGHK